MSPLGACTCGFHGTALLGTQKALRVDAEDTRPAQPVSDRHFDYAIAGLWGEQRVTRVTCATGMFIIKLPNRRQEK